LEPETQTPCAGPVATVSTILKRIRKLTRRAALPRRWPIIKTSPWVRKLKCEAVELLTALQAEYSTDELQSSRIIVPGPNNDWLLSPVFGGPSDKFILLRGPDGIPIDVISARGQLSQLQPAILRFSLAHLSELPYQSPQPIFVAESDDDIHVLYALGRQFTTAAGLETLNNEQLRQLLTPGKSIFCDVGPKYVLRIAAWQIASLQNKPSAATLKILEQLNQYERSSDYRPSDLFRAWIPTREQFDNIAKASRANREVAIQEFEDRRADCLCPIAAACQYFRERAEVDYSTARRNVERALALSIQTCVPHAAAVNAALEQWKHAFRRAVIDKLLITNSADNLGLGELRRLMASELADTWFNGQDLIVAARKVLKGEFPREYGVLDYQALRERLRLVDALVKLYALPPTPRRRFTARRSRRKKSSARPTPSEP
jgi:hypothetical protein